jgi:hypothetical protein
MNRACYSFPFVLWLLLALPTLATDPPRHAPDPSPQPANLMPDRDYRITDHGANCRILTDPALHLTHEQVKELREQLKAVYGHQSLLRVDETTSFPGSFRPVPPIKVVGPPELAAEQFLTVMRPFFRFENPEIGFRLVESNFAPDGRLGHVRWQQTYRGLDVHLIRAQVTFNVDGRMSGFSGGWPVRDVDIEPVLTPAQALAIVRSDIEPFSFTLVEEPQLGIYPVDHGMLAYYINTNVGIPGWDRRWAWRYYVHAETGHFLSVVKIDYDPTKHVPRVAPDANGRGQFGPQDPCAVEWVSSPAVTVTQTGTPPTAYAVSIELGADRDGDNANDGQVGGTRGAGIRLLPGIDYAITVSYQFSSWDSYNTDNNNQYWDVVFVNINSSQFTYATSFPPPFGNGSQNNLGPVWCSMASSSSTFLPGVTSWVGGSQPGQWCSHSNSFSPIYSETDLSKHVYVNVGIKTGTVRPTWATVNALIRPACARSAVMTCAPAATFAPNAARLS